MAIAIAVVVVGLVLTYSLGVPLPLLLYPSGARLQGRQPSRLQHDSNQDSISTCLFYRYSYLRIGEHAIEL
jgi:hypothetical protein